MTAFLESKGLAYDAQQSRSLADGIVIAPPPVNMYRAEIEAFSQALMEGQNTSELAQAGLRSQILLAACYESARTGREVPLART